MHSSSGKYRKIRRTVVVDRELIADSTDRRLDALKAGSKGQNIAHFRVQHTQGDESTYLATMGTDPIPTSRPLISFLPPHFQVRASLVSGDRQRQSTYCNDVSRPGRGVGTGTLSSPKCDNDDHRGPVQGVRQEVTAAASPESPLQTTARPKQIRTRCQEERTGEREEITRDFLRLNEIPEMPEILANFKAKGGRHYARSQNTKTNTDADTHARTRKEKILGTDTEMRAAASSSHGLILGACTSRANDTAREVQTTKQRKPTCTPLLSYSMTRER